MGRLKRMASRPGRRDIVYRKELRRCLDYTPMGIVAITSRPKKPIVSLWLYLLELATPSAFASVHLM